MADAEHVFQSENCQEVVKVELIPDQPVNTLVPVRADPADASSIETPLPTMEISAGNVTIRLFPAAGRELTETVLRYMMGGAAYAG